jgi:hypothetical protein
MEALEPALTPFRNARLKKLLAEKELDIDMLKEVSQGNF